MSDFEEYKNYILKLRDLKRSINNNFVENDKVKEELEYVYNVIFGGVNC